MENPTSRRRSERILIELPVRWRRGSRVVEATTGDISMEGLFLRVRNPERLLPGMLMELEVTLPGEPPMSLLASAVFVGQTHAGTGIGAKIFLIGDEEKQRWQRHYRLLAREASVAAA